MTTSRFLPVARVLVFMAGLLTASAVQAGWLIIDDQGAQTLLSRGRLKMAPRQADGHSMVLDLAHARLWVADSGRRLYWDGTVEEYCQGIRGTMAAAELRMAEQLEQMPPAQRQQVEQLLKPVGRGGATHAAGPPPRVTVEQTGQTDTIATLPTRKHRVFVDGKLYEELWLTTDPAFLRELELGRAPDTFGRMFACTTNAGGGRVEATPEYRQLFGQGWPLKAIYHGEGAGALRALIMRAEQREIPEVDFAPPAGFRQAPLAELFQKR